jgi:hypothetical protein
MEEGIVGIAYSPTIRQQVVSQQINKKIEDGKQVSADPQTMEMTLVTKLTVFSWTPTLGAPVEKYAILNLAEGTCFNPIANGSLMANQDDRRGWFTESIRVEICFPDLEQIELTDDSPKTTEVSGSANISNSIDLSLFGETPTAGLGFGKGVSYSLNDFKVIRTSQHIPPKVVHEYRLGMAEGVVYELPDDLITRNPGKIILDIFSNSKPGRLRNPPDRAKSSFPIISQAAFHAYQAPDHANLKITIEATVLMVEKTFLTGDAQRAHFKRDFVLDVPFGHAC